MRTVIWFGGALVATGTKILRDISIGSTVFEGTIVGSIGIIVEVGLSMVDDDTGFSPVRIVVSIVPLVSGVAVLRVGRICPVSDRLVLVETLTLGVTVELVNGVSETSLKVVVPKVAEAEDSGAT